MENHFGNKLRNFREEKGIRQRDIANALGCAPASFTYYESGKVKPSLKVLEQICGFLEISPLQLLSKNYRMFDILKILEKPIKARSYEEMVALNFSYAILEKSKLIADLESMVEKNEDKAYIYISKSTGLSESALEALNISNEFLIDYNEKVSPTGLEAVNKLLSCAPGRKLLVYIYFYLNQSNLSFEKNAKSIQIGGLEFEGFGKKVNKTFTITPDRIGPILLYEMGELLEELFNFYSN